MLCAFIRVEQRLDLYSSMQAAHVMIGHSPTGREEGHGPDSLVHVNKQIKTESSPTSMNRMISNSFGDAYHCSIWDKAQLNSAVQCWNWQG